MSFIASFGRAVLIFLNTIFILIALALLSVGVVVIGFLGAILKNSLVNNGFIELNRILNTDKIPSSLDLGPLTHDAGLALILLGVILFVVSFLACCGACYKFRVLLGLFVALVSVLMLSEIVVTPLLMSPTSPIHKTAEKSLTDVLQKDYNRTGQEGFTAAMDALMYYAHCCGIQGQGDFKNLTLTYKGVHVTVPPACCTQGAIKDGRDTHCAGTNATLSYQKGCYSALLDTVGSWKSWIIPTLIGILLIQGLEIFFSIAAIRHIGQEKTGTI